MINITFGVDFFLNTIKNRNDNYSPCDDNDEHNDHCDHDEDDYHQPPYGRPFVIFWCSIDLILRLDVF